MLLFRYIFVELVKVLIVTTAVLVAVIAFGAAIKPLAENLLGPADLVRYMAYATIPMMQFALPFSAAFAGVVVYHRLTIENEIVAMAASGIPYRRILRPAMVLGVVLTLVMLVLLDIAVPTFVRELKRILADDITRGFVAYVQRGEAYARDGTEIYADEAYVEDGPTETGASQRVRLVGVAALSLAPGADGVRVPEREFTAQFAAADIHRVGVDSHVKIVLQDATVYTRGDNALAGARVVRPESISLGRTLEEGPKGRRTGELLAIRQQPELDREVAVRRDGVFAAVDAIDIWEALAARLERDGSLRFVEEEGDASTALVYTIRGATMKGSTGAELLPRDGTGGVVTLTVTTPQGVVRRDLRSPSLVLRQEGGMTFTITLPEGSARDGAGWGVPRLFRFANLRLDEPVALLDRSITNAELVTAARERMQSTAGPSGDLTGYLGLVTADFIDRENAVRRDVVARIAQRIVHAFTAFLMVLSAAILAILFRNRSPLFVYTLAFLPAIADILLISSGEQMLRASTSALGFVVLSIGNVMLAVVCVVGAWRLGRH